MDLSKRRGNGTWRAVGLSLVVLGTTRPVWGDTTVPNTFTAGTTISASQVNENFATLGTAMPAGTSLYSYGTANLGTAATALIGLTVTPPADGMMAVSGTAIYTITQGAAGDDMVFAILEMSVGSSSSVTPEVRLRLNTTGGVAQTLASSLTVSHLFAVTAGVATTFKLWGTKAGSATDKYEMPRIDVVFLPNRLACKAVSSSYSYGCD